MNKDAVQHERGPRTSTLRRQQISNLFEARDSMFVSSTGGALNLAVPKAVSPLSSMSLTPPLDISFPHGVPPLSTLPGAYSSIFSMPKLPLPMTSMLPTPVLSPAVICESAARLLFMNVQWTKTITQFTSLPLQDQLLLLEESWRELFILGAAQFLPIADLTTLVYSCGALDRIFNKAMFLQRVQQFEEVLSNVRQFQLDNQEYACLRATALFKISFEDTSMEICPDSTSSPEHNQQKSLTDAARIASIQDDAQLALNKYITSVHPDQPLRFGKLLLLISTFRNVSGETIEELFFRRTIGNIPIVRIMCDMYKSQPSSTI
ncbi:unnamed protein product [Acanthoscelides obtectus]|uniref:NR LBD domain-containing protein n=1 Tax=Acanthoscelides obtectus TaxID=200917 RepID=A0A9P0KKF7_ACAOB|nr:unnamed protein product [Acanthoscelides obtectus]CAK1666668.1 Nuclear receptor subfamily 2 group E member 1 [Acanthoscelides obtectus]